MTTGGWGKRHAAFLIGAAASLGNFIGAAGVEAQTPPQSLSVEGSVRFELDVDDNSGLRETSPGTDTKVSTILGLDANLETPLQTFSLSLDADLQYEDRAAGREEQGFQNPVARLVYRLRGADSELGFSGTFRTDDFVDSLFIDTDGDEETDSALTSDGTVDRLNLRADYSFGLTAPFGADFFVSRDERNFQDVVNPDRFDRETDTYGITGRFRINPATTGRLIFREERFSAEDAVQTDRDTTDYGVGLDYTFRPDLRFSGEVTQTEIDEETTGGNTERDGISAELGVFRDVSNGSFGIVASRTQSTNTARSDIEFTRNITVPQGSFSFGVGVSSSDTGDTALIGSIDYANVVPSGVITATLSRTAEVNDSNNEVQRTRLGLGYSYDINRISGIAFDLDVVDLRDIGAGDATDSTRADFSVTYRRQITEDWDWRIGYQGRY
ncbi:MAG: hypothetical protein AAGD13_25555, partial [Pseudomonadota bacterium]